MAAVLPPGFDLHADLHRNLLRVIIPFIPISTVAVALRLWSRLISREKLWWDDLCTFGAWACGVVILALGIVAGHNGVGKHTVAVVKLEPEEFVRSQKVVYAAFIIFAIAITLVKLAALTFYSRIFQVVTSFRIALYVCHALTIAWLLSNLPLTVFYCVPIDKFWYPEKQGRCINLFYWHITEGVFDVSLNFLILCLPMPMVWSLRASVGRKLLLMLAFFFGYLALVPSIGRLVSTAVLGRHIGDDFYFDVVDIEWSLVEPAICVISLCIPSWFQLAKRVRTFGVRSLFSLRDPTTKARLRGPISQNDRLFNERLANGAGSCSRFHRLADESVFDAMGMGNKFVVESGFARELGSNDDIELGEDSIQMHQEVFVENNRVP